jgi:1-aminocyclopropane-1-carboxylate deaminase
MTEAVRKMLSYTPTPVQEIFDPLFDKAGVRVLIKREDLNHPFVSGNKWWKLKYNLEQAINVGHKTLLTFGGAYSNHIYATAAAAKESELASIGIIRGEETLPLNQTLSFARDKGMELLYVTRENYRRKGDQDFLKELKDRFGDFYLIPEGGTNELAVQGVEEFSKTLGNDFDFLCCAIGTGGTIAGLINGVPSDKKVIGFSVLKGGDFLAKEIKNLLQRDYSFWSIITDYHFGGYAKSNRLLNNFISQFESAHRIPLEHVYTAKLIFGIFDLVGKGYFKPGSTLLVLHSGGLQGRIIP